MLKGQRRPPPMGVGGVARGGGKVVVTSSSSKTSADSRPTEAGNGDNQRDENDDGNNPGSNFGGGLPVREKRIDHLAKFTRKKLNSNPVKNLDKTILDKSTTKKRLLEYDRVEAQVAKEREVDSSVKEIVLEGLTRSWTMLGDITMCATVNANVPSSLVMQKELIKSARDYRDKEAGVDDVNRGGVNDVDSFNESVSNMIYSMHEASNAHYTEVFEDEKEVKRRVDAALELLTSVIDSQDAVTDNHIDVDAAVKALRVCHKTEKIPHTLYESIPIEKKRENMRQLKLNDLKVESRGFAEGFLGLQGVQHNRGAVVESAPPVDGSPLRGRKGEQGEISRISSPKPPAAPAPASDAPPLGNTQLYDEINGAMRAAALQRSRTPVRPPINSEELEMYHNLYSLCNKAIGEIDSVVDSTIFDASKNIVKMAEDQNFNNHVYNHNMKQLHDNVNDAARVINSMSSSITSSHTLPLPSISIGIDGYRTASTGNTFDEYSQQLQTLQMLQQQQIQQQQIQLQQLQLQLSPYLSRSSPNAQQLNQQELPPQISDPTHGVTGLNIDQHFFNNFKTHSVTSKQLPQDAGMASSINYDAYNKIKEQEYPPVYPIGNAVANASARVHEGQKQKSNRDALKNIRIKQWNDNFTRDINYDVVNEEKMRKRAEVAENYRVRKELLEKKKIEEMQFIKAKSYFLNDSEKKEILEQSSASRGKSAATGAPNPNPKSVDTGAFEPPVNAARRPPGIKPSVASRQTGGGIPSNFYAQGLQGLRLF